MTQLRRTPITTAKQDKSYWRFWCEWCAVMDTAPLRTDTAANARGNIAEVTLRARAHSWRGSWPTQSCCRPACCIDSAVSRACTKRWGTPSARWHASL
eukprot:851808-Pleurochrysis_carterae.AAC.1